MRCEVNQSVANMYVWIFFLHLFYGLANKALASASLKKLVTDS